MQMTKRSDQAVNTARSEIHRLSLKKRSGILHSPLGC